jgi:long-chain-fatty-acid--[acyl-carrier-protein] ligase
MLNWTVGQKILEHCIEEASVEYIFTASSFIEKVKEQIPESIHKMLVFIDKEVPQTSIYTKLKGVVKSKSPSILLNTKNIDPIAVILFTSGSESLPKAVPLSHDNIINNLKGTLDLINLDNNNILLGFLPPFHSFGFSILSILPLITGGRIAYSPDPTNAKAIVRVLEHTASTVLVAAPSFLKNILSNSTSNQLKSLHYAVSGAEALPKEIITYFQHMVPGGTIIEGYGITECSPVLSLNPLSLQKENSVGKVIPGVSCKIINIENNQILPPNQEGMICVKGKNVFNGYTDKTIASPFIQIEGQKYYKTGDMGYLDEDGYLFITGRLKRFVKIAGEMISLQFIENILLQHYNSDDEKKILAVEGSDKIQPTQIVLFSTKPISKSEANTILKQQKLPPIAKITKVVMVDSIPLLGSGKVDYKTLKSSIVNG